MDVLIFNPNAGTAKRMGLSTEQLIGMLAERGISATTPPGELTEDEIVEVAKKASGRIIVAGGDGTIHSLLKAATTCPLLKIAIIPIGTANHLATAIGIPEDIPAAIDAIASGHTRRIDLGIVNGVVFTQAAGAGFHARAFHVYGERKTKSFKDAATAAIEIARGWEPKPMRIRVDDEIIRDELTQVTVANTPSYGRLFTIAPDAKIDDGLLDVILIGALSKLELAEYALAAMNGTMTGLPKTYTRRGRRIVIESIESEPIDIHADATPAGHTPAEVNVLPGCLEVVVKEES